MITLFFIKYMWYWIVSYYEPPTPIQNIQDENRLVVVIWEKIMLLLFILQLFRVHIFYHAIMIFVYIIPVECVQPPTPKNNTLERWEVHLNDLLYLSDITYHLPYQVLITMASTTRLVELNFHSTVLCNMPIINILGVKMMSICPHRWEWLHLYEKLTNDGVICLKTNTLIY